MYCFNSGFIFENVRLNLYCERRVLTDLGDTMFAKAQHKESICLMIVNATVKQYISVVCVSPPLMQNKLCTLCYVKQAKCMFDLTDDLPAAYRLETQERHVLHAII